MTKLDWRSVETEAATAAIEAGTRERTAGQADPWSSRPHALLVDALADALEYEGLLPDDDPRHPVRDAAAADREHTLKRILASFLSDPRTTQGLGRAVETVCACGGPSTYRPDAAAILAALAADAAEDVEV